MKANILTSVLLASALLFTAAPAYPRHNEGHRGQNRTEKQHNSRPNNRPGNNNGNNRPGKNSGNRPDKHYGKHHDRHPGGNSYQRPGGNRPDYNRPPKHHNNWHPAPPPPGPRPHPHYHGYRPRPAVGINVSFGGVNLFYSNGLYYNYYSPTQYVVTLPPLGMVVSQLFNAAYQWVNNGYYYVSQGVVYAPVQTPYGIQYRVTDYIY